MSDQGSELHKNYPNIGLLRLTLARCMLKLNMYSLYTVCVYILQETKDISIHEMF